jgi:hypothetical protein
MEPASSPPQWLRGETEATRARAHINELVCSQNFSLRSISRAAGVSSAVVQQIHSGDQGRVSRHCERLILNVTQERILQTAGGRNFVPKTGTIRRLEALQAIGWPLALISETSGVNAEEIRHNRGPWVQAVQASAIRDAYARVSDSRGPSSRTSIRAAKLGYLSPIHWDDDTIDDATVAPTEMPARQKRAEAIVEDVDFLIRTGSSLHEISERLGRPWPTIARRLYRYGRHDLIAQAQQAS